MKTIHIEVNDFLAAIIGIAAGVLLVIFPQESLNAVSYTHLPRPSHSLSSRSSGQDASAWMEGSWERKRSK